MLIEKIKYLLQPINMNLKAFSKHLFLIILLSAIPVSAEKWNPLRNEIIPIGARAIGMGGAFISIADNANAMHYNPAGLAQIKNNEIVTSLDWNPLIKGLYKINSGLIYPFKKVNIIGISGNFAFFRDSKKSNYSGNQFPELTYMENEIKISFARRISDLLYIGANIRYFRFSTTLDKETRYSVNTVGADLGMLFRITDKIKTGFMIDNLIPFKNFYSGGGKSSNFRLPGLRFGVSYRIKKNILAAFDIDENINIGFEYWIANLIGLRAGFKMGYMSRDEIMGNLQWAIGLGFRYKFFELNYAWPASPLMLANQVLSVNFSWGYHAYLVDVVSAKIDDMFASLYKTYSREDIVKVIVKNKTKNPVEASVGIKISGLMNNSVSKKVFLKPGVPTEVRLPIIFDPDKVMAVKDDSARTAKILVSYDHEGKKSEDTASTKFVLYSRNAFIWDDVEKLSSFVTPQDDKIKEFARSILQTMRANSIREKIISDNFYKAMLLFDALGAYGQIYIVDPSNPYGAAALVSGTAIDYLQFPQETLKQKSGDCDDCTVLFASILENVGIPTMLVDVPEHIFMMFDSGISPSDAKNIFLNENSYILLNSRVWIPVETTMFGKTFQSAWKEGLNTFTKWLIAMNISESDSSMHLVSVRKAWEKYPSSAIKEKSWEIGLPNEKQINRLFKLDIDEYLINKDGSEFKDLLNTLQNDPKNIDALNKLGIKYARNGVFNIGENCFKRVLEIDQNNLKARNNLGNIYLMAGNYEQAINEYKKILKIDPDRSSTKKNLLKAMEAKKGE